MVKSSSGEPNAPLATRLARWILDFKTSPIPQEISTLIKFSILDSIGCAFLAPSEKAVQNILRAIRLLGEQGKSTVIGNSMRTSVINAVLANSALIHAIEFDDHLVMDPADGMPLGGHPSMGIAVSLSVGECQKKPGSEVLAATVLGYEVFGRFNKLLSRNQPWDHSTAYGLVAPAVAGLLMGLKEEQLAHALALSLAHCATLGAVRDGNVSASKFLAGSIVLETGTLATILASQGVTGPVGAFENSRRGLVPGVMPGMDPSILALPIGKTYMAEGVTIKAYPGIAHAQAAIAAALKVKENLTVPLDDLDLIEFSLNDTPATRKNLEDEERRYPRSKETADHSFPFMLAVALLDGELTLRQFEGERWFDPDVRALMDRITLRMDKSLNTLGPGTFPCRLRVVTRKGEEQVVEVPYAPGHPRNRLSASAVEAKFSRCVEGMLDKNRRDAIIRHVFELESLPSVEVLMKDLAST